MQFARQRLGDRKTNFHSNLFYLRLYFLTSLLARSLFLCNTGLASKSLKDQLVFVDHPTYLRVWY